MGDSLDVSAATLGQVPAHQRHRILSGMRWSVWLSAVAMPFSVGTNLLLARVGPETVGVYGLLGVYIGLITAFIYFGGNTVVIRFIPECKREDRAAFLASYLLVIFAVLSFWLVFAHLFPSSLGLVLGQGPAGRFRFIILCLAPIPIAFSMIFAFLKWLLEIRSSQTLLKLLTIISFLMYAAIFVVARPLLLSEPIEVVWSIYLGLMAMLATIGAVHVVRLCGMPRLRFYLPQGFWRYAFATQLVGMVSFLTSRLDYVLILNLGGLGVLGRYVAIMSVAATVLMVNDFFMDTLLPSLTNMIAARNHAGAAEIFMMHMRILFFVTTAASCAVMVAAVPVAAIMGGKYRSIQGLIILMAMFWGIASPGAIGGTLLASVGRQQLAIWAGLLHVLVFTCLFFAMWPRWHLTGAVVSYGLAVLLSETALMTIALKTSRIYPSIAGLWLKAAGVETAVGIIALRWLPPGLISGIVTWLAAMGLFLLLAQYRASECKAFARTFLPGAALRPVSGTERPVLEPVTPGIVSS